MIVGIILVVIGCIILNGMLVMFAFGILHSIFPEYIPAISFIQALFVTFALGVIGSFFKGSK
jgi:hypothetical protein